MGGYSFINWIFDDDFELFKNEIYLEDEFDDDLEEEDIPELDWEDLFMENY